MHTINRHGQTTEASDKGSYLSNKARVHITGTAGILSEQQSRALLGQPCLVQREGRLLLGLQLLHLCLHLHLMGNLSLQMLLL